MGRMKQLELAGSYLFQTGAVRKATGLMTFIVSELSALALSCDRCPWVWVPKTCATWPDVRWPLAARPVPPARRGMIFGLWG
jgi:hypothetical protein